MPGEHSLPRTLPEGWLCLIPFFRTCPPGGWRVLSVFLPWKTSEKKAGNLSGAGHSYNIVGERSCWVDSLKLVTDAHTKDARRGFELDAAVERLLVRVLE